MRATRFVITSVVSLFLVTTICFAQAPVIDDTYVVQSSPNSNFGTSAALAVQSPRAYTFIRLDVSRLPGGITASQVTHATIRLFVTAVTAPGSFDVCEVTGNWNESTLTYNNGGQSLISSSGPCIPNAGSITTASKNEYIEVDVTQFVKDWLNGATNYGIVLKPTGSLSVTFESKDSTATSHDAELDAGVTGPTGAIGPTGPTGPRLLARLV